jgi:hypothetical protein
VAQIDQAIAEIAQLGAYTRYDQLKLVRQAYDGPAKAIYSPSVTQDFQTVNGGKLGAADVTGALREHLAKLDPQTAEANAAYSFYRKAHDVLDATAEVERTRPTVGRRMIAKLTGTMLGEQAAGPAGAFLGYALGPVVETISGAGWTTKIKTAQLMSRLAAAIRKGDEGLVTSLSYDLKRLGAQASAIVGATSPSESQTPATAPAR